MKKNANLFGENKPLKNQIVYLFINKTFGSVHIGNNCVVHTPQHVVINGEKAFYRGNFWRILDFDGTVTKQIQTAKDDKWYPAQ